MSRANVFFPPPFFFFQDRGRFRVNFLQQQSLDIYQRERQVATWLVFQKDKSVKSYGVYKEISQ